MEINATFLGQGLAFVIFVVLCMKWVWPPLINALEKRQKEIADGLASAEKAKKNLELASAGAAETLRKAKAQAQKIVDDAQKQRSLIIDKAANEANEEKQRILQAAQAEIEAEKNKAREEIRAYAISLALTGAERILNEKVDSQYDQQMIKKIMESL